MVSMDDQGSQDNRGQESMEASSITDQNAILVEEDDPALLSHKEVLQGTLPGNTRVRIVRPSHQSFRRLSTGLLEATELTQAPRGGLSRVVYNIKHVLIGAPLTTAQAEHERLTKFKALAVLSSDAISSVAYATEAILITLVAAGSGKLGLTVPISFAIVDQLAIVAISYRQTVPAYPNGGGSFIVAKDNIGKPPGPVCAALPMIYYLLDGSVFGSSRGICPFTPFSLLSFTAH